MIKPVDIKIKIALASMCVIGVAIFIFALHHGRDKQIPTAETCTSFALECVCCGEIVANQALFWALSKKGVGATLIENFRAPLSQVLDLRRIQPGDKYKLVQNSAGGFEYFELIRSPWEKYVVEKSGEKLLARKDTIPLSRVIVCAKGEVQNTLWESMRSCKIEPQAIMDFTDVLAFDFDFVTDTRNGHKFEIVYEKLIFEDSTVAMGKVLLARYDAKDTVHTAVLFKDPSGKESYYDLRGGSMRKSLLKAPLKFSRISSSFSYSRLHPILKIYRPHLGIDYAAPTGTPIVASGSGKVIFAGWKGGYGNYIHLRHNDGIETTYGHLSSFARGVKTGANVDRGEVIGYVGATGLASGPHLDYRVMVKGKFVNPAKYAFPAEPPLDRRYLDAYKTYAQTVVEGARILASSYVPEKNTPEPAVN